MYELIRIQDDFHCLSSLGGSWPTSSNVYAITDADGVSLFDTGIDNPDCFAGLCSCLEKAGRHIEDVHTIVLTHGHPDHVGGTAAICRRANPRVLIPERSIAEAVDPVQQDYFCLPPQARAIAPRLRDFDILDNFRRTCGDWSLESVRLTPIRDDDTVKAGRYAFRAVHTPGHDVGLICLYEPDAKILLTGDLLRSTGAGGALPWYTSTAGGVDAYLNSLERVAALDVRRTLPAHGAVDGNFVEMVGKTREIILGRESAILSLLRAGPRTCEELDAELYRPIVLQLCPWFSTVTESPLSRLEKAGAVRRSGFTFALA